MDQDIGRIQSSLTLKLSSVSSLLELDQIETEYLGRKGHINELFQKLGGLPHEEMRNAGQAINTLKQEVTAALSAKRAELSSQNKTDILSAIDTTAPGNKPKLGHLHPTTETIRSINSFFRYLGFSVYEGPEIETNEFNFEKLNLPLDHPARDLQDTLYIQEPEWLLRTHTSSVEARAMTDNEPPIRIVAPGKVYRNETSNATNNCVFYQYQGLLIDRDISLADLRGTLSAFLRFLYGNDVKTRIRCKYYPEVEPGAGMDVQCSFCKGDGCQVCKYRGWIEVLGSGMVHPNTLRACNIDPKEWSGFAFGLGLDRLVMLKYGIDDVRKLYSGALVFEE
jgi:phenylalanyl-tRNA synthetase alpha chain